MENFLSSNEVFTVDLTGSKSPADVIFELSHVLDNHKAFGKNIYLKLANIDLSQSQLLSLKSLISSINSKLCFIECPSSMTIASAQSIGIETPSNPPINPISEENNFAENQNFENVSQEPQLSDAEIEAKKYINLDMFNQSTDSVSDFPNNDENVQNQDLSEENFENTNFEFQNNEQQNQDWNNQEQINQDWQNQEQNFEQQNQNEDNQNDYDQNWNNENQENQDNQITENYSECQDCQVYNDYQNNNQEENNEWQECENCGDYQENNEWQNNQEQTLDDFAPRQEETNYEETQENNDFNYDNYSEQNNEKFVFADSSLNFDNYAQNTKNEHVDNALEDIFATEKKLEHILEEKEERTTIDLCEPLDNTYTQEDEQIEKMNVKYVKQTVRSGNVISSDGNLVIIGDCHPGSEIHAAGDITVWGLLGGIAHAGNKGNKKAKVRALKLNPIQLRIANLYTRRPDALHTIYVEKTSTFTPEEARIINDEIVIYTMNEK